MTSPTLEAALSYADIGWPVFPVGQDKAPLTKHGFQDATLHEGVINEWWGSQFPEANVALGIPEGLVILDFDPRNGAPDPSIFEGFTRALTALTPSGGAHLYFTIDPDVALAGKLMGGVDVKLGGKGYVLLPPSTNGENDYVWLRGEAITELKERIIPLPEWCLESLRKRTVSFDLGLGDSHGDGMFQWDLGTQYGMFGLHSMVGLVFLARNGERNNALNRAGYRIGQYVAAGEVKEAALYEVARAAEATGLDRDEIAETLRSAYEAGLRKPWKR